MIFLVFSTVYRYILGHINFVVLMTLKINQTYDQQTVYEYKCS